MERECSGTNERVPTNGHFFYIYGAIKRHLWPYNDARFTGRKATTLDPRLPMSRMTEGEGEEGGEARWRRGSKEGGPH